MSKKTTDLPEKVTPIWNDEVTWLDSQDSTLSTKDKRFKLSNMWSAIFWNRNTDNIPEWSNLYYTEARVQAKLDNAYEQLRAMLTNLATSTT